MRAISVTCLAMLLVAALAGQGSAANYAKGHWDQTASYTKVAAEPDYPPFGSEGWWDEEEDRGG
jgi:hypothetical protein